MAKLTKEGILKKFDEFSSTLFLPSVEKRIAAFKAFSEIKGQIHPDDVRRLYEAISEARKHPRKVKEFQNLCIRVKEKITRTLQ